MLKLSINALNESQSSVVLQLFNYKIIMFWNRIKKYPFYVFFLSKVKRSGKGKIDSLPSLCG